MTSPPLGWATRREPLLVLAGTVPLLCIFAALYLPLLPNGEGTLPSDFALWLPDLLVGDYWFANNGPWSLPWFSPAECAGVAFFPDPQVPYLSFTQALTLVVSPMAAVQATILAAAGAGFLGTYALARTAFRASPAASLLAGVLFMFNSFFATRMLIGHLPYYPFMLLPLLLLAALPWGTPGRGTEGLRIGAIAVLVAATIQAGMVQLVVPMGLTIGLVLMLAGLTVGWSWRAVARLALGTLFGVALSAEKLAGAFALLAHYPRDRYALPGFLGVWNALWLPVQMLFLGPPLALQESLFYDPFPLSRQVGYQQHEFVYGVTPVPAVLLLAAAAVGLIRLRGRLPRPGRAGAWCVAGLLVLVAVPIAANAYMPGWNAWLKSLPLLHNSSNLMRWFAGYILPVTLAGGLALDRLAGRHRARIAAPAAVAGVLFVLVWLVRTDLLFYENQGFGATAFPIAPIEQGWARLHAGGAVPPVTTLNNEVDRAYAASFATGGSQLPCYWPIFGYWREDFLRGTLHPGDPLVADAGRLNLRNPVCDIFPNENDCRPGDQFRAEDRAAAEALLHYRPLPLRRPWWLDAAMWLNVVAALGLVAMLAVSGWWHWQARRGRCPRPAKGREAL